MTPEALALEGAIIALRKFKQMLIDGEPYMQIVHQAQREIRELENWQRTGERTPPSVLEVQP